MNAFQKMANTGEPLFFGKGRGAVIQLAQVRARGKNGLPSASDNTDGSLRRQQTECSNKFFQFGEHGRAYFIGRLMIERQLDNPFAPFPTQRFAGEGFHACRPLTASRLPSASYTAFI